MWPPCPADAGQSGPVRSRTRRPEVGCGGGRGGRQLGDSLDQDRDRLLVSRLRPDGEVGRRSDDRGAMGQQGRGRVTVQAAAQWRGNVLIDGLTEQVVAER